jgi:hypothetical protein
MKKIILVLLITLGLGLTQIATDQTPAFAEKACTISAECPNEQICIERTCKDNNNLNDTKFSVTKYLRMEGQGERAAYFTEGEHSSPIVNLIISVIDFAIIVIGTIAVILIIVAGFRFMFAQGNEQSLTEAKDMFKYAIMGLAIALLSYTIATFVQSIFIAV